MERKFTWNDENKEVVKVFLNQVIDILFQEKQARSNQEQLKKREIEKFMKLLGFSERHGGTHFIQSILEQDLRVVDIQNKKLCELCRIDPRDRVRCTNIKRKMRYAIFAALEKRTPLAMELYTEYFWGEHVKLTTKRFLKVAIRYLERLEKYPQ